MAETEPHVYAGDTVVLPLPLYSFGVKYSSCLSPAGEVGGAAQRSRSHSAAEPASAAPAARIASEAQACRLSSRSETSICALALLH